ncbi:hypothetical protein [Ornithinimicrobium murale]|uniref:hypothetical protein n=1 Tax=Ornithinimicrobium murale TaxID=1050153 RepID=UPI000E0CEDF3|nr:hypothetical protein [Ornithinimicrobium murale]
MSNHQLAALVNSRVDIRQLLALVRAPFPVAELGQDIRWALANHIYADRVVYTCWQEAWNDLTGATPHRAGQLRLTPDRCQDCHGRRFALDRRLGQFGPCTSCMGRGNGKPLTLTALYATEPEATDV